MYKIDVTAEDLFILMVKIYSKLFVNIIEQSLVNII